MPTRLKCRDKPQDRAQPTEDKGLSAPLAGQKSIRRSATHLGLESTLHPRGRPRKKAEK